MRLGADPIKLHDGTRVREIYGEAVVYERHRHRYEVNNLLRKRLEAAGLCTVGHLARRAPGRGDRARASTRSSSPRSSTRSSSRARSAPRRCSATSSPPRSSAPPTVRLTVRRRMARMPRWASAPTCCDARRRPLTRRRARAALPEWDVRRAVPDREPVGPRARVRRARDRRAARARLDGRTRTTPAPRAGSDCGNLLARIPAERPVGARRPARAPADGRRPAERRSLLLCAHLDTVPLLAPGRAGARRRRLGERERGRSSAPTTRPRSP